MFYCHAKSTTHTVLCDGVKLGEVFRTDFKDRYTTLSSIRRTPTRAIFGISDPTRGYPGVFIVAPISTLVDDFLLTVVVNLTALFLTSE